MFEAISRGPEEDGGKLNSYRQLVDKAAVVDYSIYSQKVAYL